MAKNGNLIINKNVSEETVCCYVTSVYIVTTAVHDAIIDDLT